MDGEFCASCQNHFAIDQTRESCYYVLENCVTPSNLSTRQKPICEKCGSGFELNPTGSICMKEIANCQKYAGHSDHMYSTCEKCEPE